ncbi:MAG: phosphoribosylformylglycinamidine synthase I [Promethearchaeota archaeon]
MTIAIVKFPGTNSEKDVLRALQAIPAAEPQIVLSREDPTLLLEADGVIIPGGLSYGDYVRANAASSIDEMRDVVRDIADSGKPMLGIGNGFQILSEFKILPGSLKPNKSGRFVSKWVYLRVCENPTKFTDGLEGKIVRIPVAHSEGRYQVGKKRLERLNNSHEVVLRYCDVDGDMTTDANPNGSIENIAGVVNENGNVLGLMPHPERAVRTEAGSNDGLLILENFVRTTLDQ